MAKRNPGEGAYSGGHLKFTHVSYARAPQTLAPGRGKPNSDPDRSGIGAYSSGSLRLTGGKPQPPTTTSATASGPFILDKSKLGGPDVLG